MSGPGAIFFSTTIVLLIVIGQEVTKGGSATGYVVWLGCVAVVAFFVGLGLRGRARP